MPPAGDSVKKRFEKNDLPGRVNLASLEKSAGEKPDDPGVHYRLAEGYRRVAGKTGGKYFYKLAERSARKAIELEPMKKRYHILLVTIMAEKGELGLLSSQYRRKADGEEGEFYREILNKMSLIASLSIPDPDEKNKKRRPKGSLFFNYILMPFVVAGALIVWVVPGYEGFRLISLALVFLYILLRISAGARKI